MESREVLLQERLDALGLKPTDGCNVHEGVFGLYSAFDENHPGTYRYLLLPKSFLDDGFDDVLEWALENELVWAGTVGPAVYIEVLNDKLRSLFQWLKFQEGFLSEVGNDEEFNELEREFIQAEVAALERLGQVASQKDGKVPVAVCVADTDGDIIFVPSDGPGGQSAIAAFPLSLRSVQLTLESLDIHVPFKFTNSFKAGEPFWVVDAFDVQELTILPEGRGLVINL